MDVSQFLVYGDSYWLIPDLERIHAEVELPWSNIYPQACQFFKIELEIVLAMESNTFKCRVREAMKIRLCKPALNRNNGFELASTYDTILAP